MLSKAKVVVLHLLVAGCLLSCFAVNAYSAEEASSPAQWPGILSVQDILDISQLPSGCNEHLFPHWDGYGYAQALSEGAFAPKSLNVVIKEAKRDAKWPEFIILNRDILHLLMINQMHCHSVFLYLSPEAFYRDQELAMDEACQQLGQGARLNRINYQLETNPRLALSKSQFNVGCQPRDIDWDLGDLLIKETDLARQLTLGDDLYKTIQFQLATRLKEIAAEEARLAAGPLPVGQDIDPDMNLETACPDSEIQAIPGSPEFWVPNCNFCHIMHQHADSVNNPHQDKDKRTDAVTHALTYFSDREKKILCVQCHHENYGRKMLAGGRNAAEATLDWVTDKIPLMDGSIADYDLDSAELEIDNPLNNLNCTTCHKTASRLEAPFYALEEVDNYLALRFYKRFSNLHEKEKWGERSSTLEYAHLTHDDKRQVDVSLYDILHTTKAEMIDMFCLSDDQVDLIKSQAKELLESIIQMFANLNGGNRSIAVAIHKKGISTLADFLKVPAEQIAEAADVDKKRIYRMKSHALYLLRTQGDAAEVVIKSPRLKLLERPGITFSSIMAYRSDNPAEQDLQAYPRNIERSFPQTKVHCSTCHMPHAHPKHLNESPELVISEACQRCHKPGLAKEGEIQYATFWEKHQAGTDQLIKKGPYKGTRRICTECHNKNPDDPTKDMFDMHGLLTGLGHSSTKMQAKELEGSSDEKYAD